MRKTISIQHLGFMWAHVAILFVIRDWKSCLCVHQTFSALNMTYHIMQEVIISCIWRVVRHTAVFEARMELFSAVFWAIFQIFVFWNSLLNILIQPKSVIFVESKSASSVSWLYKVLLWFIDVVQLNVIDHFCCFYKSRLIVAAAGLNNWWDLCTACDMFTEKHPLYFFVWKKHIAQISFKHL